MAHLRLIATGLVLAACGRAGAEPAQATSGLKPPAGWQAQPAIAAAARDALGKIPVDGLEAVGEPAIGCYAVWMAVRGSGSAKNLSEQLVRGLTEHDKKTPAPKRAPAKRGLAIRDVVKPTGDEGILALTFESAPYKGRLRARVGKGRITALACFSAEREPATCETACTGLLGSIP